MKLSEIKPRIKCRVINVSGEGSTHRRLLDMGCVKGTIIEIVKVAPLGDPIDILIRGYHLSIRKDEAKDIEVELI
jgi:Fe2+ transport system protein FeoA